MNPVLPVGHLEPGTAFLLHAALQAHVTPDKAAAWARSTFSCAPGVANRAARLLAYISSGWCSTVFALHRVAMPQNQLEADTLAARIPESTEVDRLHAYLAWQCVAPWADRSPPPLSEAHMPEPAQSLSRPRRHWAMEG